MLLRWWAVLLAVEYSLLVMGSGVGFWVLTVDCSCVVVSGCADEELERLKEKKNQLVSTQDVYSGVALDTFIRSLILLWDLMSASAAFMLFVLVVP